MKKVIICGAVIPEKLEKKLPAASPAGSKYMRNMAMAFQNIGYEVIYTAYIALPGAKKVFQDYEEQNYYYVIKDKIIVPSVLKYQRMVDDMAEEGDIVIFYNVDYSRWGLLKRLNKKKVKCVLILADHTQRNECNNFIRKYMADRDETEMRKFVYAVLLSPYAVEFVGTKCKYEIIEGGLNMDIYTGISKPQKHKKINLMYAGTLGYVTGVDELLVAFNMMQSKDVELFICGKGELTEEVKKAAELDDRIHFLGYITEEEYISYLAEADILINPRNMKMKQNQYNFPSKILEYLASGRIIVSTKFPGWERFKKNIIFYDGNAQELFEVMKNKDILLKTCNEQYIINRKCASDFEWDSHAKKIIAMCENA